MKMRKTSDIISFQQISHNLFGRRTNKFAIFNSVRFCIQSGVFDR